MKNDRLYFRQRATEERSAAAHARGRARRAHEEMAELYKRRSDIPAEKEEGEPVA